MCSLNYSDMLNDSGWQLFVCIHLEFPNPGAKSQSNLDLTDNFISYMSTFAYSMF
mgnify:CR=1 FL=1